VFHVYFFKIGALVWRLFSLLQKSSDRSASLVIARAGPTLSKSKKAPVRLLKNSRLRVFSGCLGTGRGRD